MEESSAFRCRTPGKAQTAQNWRDAGKMSDRGIPPFDADLKFVATSVNDLSLLNWEGVKFLEVAKMALPAGTKAKTGEKCPQGGVWHPVGNPTETRAIGIGNVMPPTPKGETHWVLKTPTGDK